MGVRFAISYHSFGPLLLYPQGWQTLTPSADDPIYVALTGRDTDPAVPGFNPGVSADLYTTNGEFTDWAHAVKGTLAWTPELEEGCEGCGFVFPDDEALVQAEFQKNLDFAVNVAKSALAKRAAGAVTLHYSVNAAAEQTAPTDESPDGERYGGNNAYYHYLRGQIPGLKQGTRSSTGSAAAARPPSASPSTWWRTPTTPTC